MPPPTTPPMMGTKSPIGGSVVGAAMLVLVDGGLVLITRTLQRSPSHPGLHQCENTLATCMFMMYMAVIFTRICGF